MTMIFTNGCWDMFHVGHLHILKKAKELGGDLHVGINSDKSIKALKGPTRPIIPQEQRVEIVSSIKYVDYVHIFDEETPIKLIERLQPDVIVKGGDWGIEEVIGKDLAVVVLVPLLPNISTSKIISNIQKLK